MGRRDPPLGRRPRGIGGLENRAALPPRVQGGGAGRAAARPGCRRAQVRAKRAPLFKFTFSQQHCSTELTRPMTRIPHCPSLHTPLTAVATAAGPGRGGSRAWPSGTLPCLPLRPCRTPARRWSPTSPLLCAWRPPTVGPGAPGRPPWGRSGQRQVRGAEAVGSE